MNNNNELLIEAKSLFKSYKTESHQVDVLLDLNLKVHKGEALCIMGSSGTGKTTLLHLLGTLDQPSSGYIFYKGKDIFDQTSDALAFFS